MTTEQLRKEIEVANWHINYAGISITYYRTYENNTKPIPIDIKLTPEECAIQLSAIGSIDSWEADTFLLNYENSKLHWAAFVNAFKLSQWEAFTLALRHEQEKEIENEIDNGDIGKAIDRITK